ncbi:TRAP transporter small permease [Algoriphagus sp. CAU 1675]|uniref:TRAP transporter small permease n=1 Tax=Algoriphagus sp. CAU 1675 TaxID=3032597 RepID=UPI0023DB576A|nr:TRAP transporter small permease [Algoriphagus sp. CAU 1675]MDF2159084.1 TRAP transporter small permease [Algoriphagus sp. CAU 1675]
MFSPGIKNSLDKWVAAFLIFLMAFMVVNVSWQVASRYILKDPSSFTDELARYMLIWVGMLGSAYVAGKNEHLAIDIVMTKMSPRNVFKTKVLIHACVLVFALTAMVIGGINLVYITFILDQTSAALRIPLAYVYAIIPFSGLLVIYYQIGAILQLFKDQKTS